MALKTNHNSSNTLKKVFFTLDKSDSHQHATESLWAEALGDNQYRIKNVPFYANGISFDDVIEVSHDSDQLFVKSIVTRSGHSTYRIFLLNENQFDMFWKPLESLGCTYEKVTEHLFAIDVPPEADIYKTYEHLEAGEENQVWEFEEAHVGHKLKK